jgi:hypothetical protein
MKKNLPKLDAAWTPYTRAERAKVQQTMFDSNGPPSYDSALVNELIGRYEATIEQYENPGAVDVQIIDGMHEEDRAIAFEVLRRWNVALSNSEARLKAELVERDRQITGLETRIRVILDEMVSVPDGTFLRELAGEIRGWAHDEAGPLQGYADEIANHLEDVAIVISKEGNQP